MASPGVEVIPRVIFPASIKHTPQTVHKTFIFNVNNIKQWAGAECATHKGSEYTGGFELQASGLGDSQGQDGN